MKSITAYREYDSFFTNDNDLSPLASSLGFGSTTFHSFSQELRLNGAAFADDRMEYTLGAFYMDQRTIYQTTQDLRYSRTSLTQFQGDDPINADTLAFFGHLSYTSPTVSRPTLASATPTSTRTTPSAATPMPVPCCRRWPRCTTGPPTTTAASSTTA